MIRCYYLILTLYQFICLWHHYQNVSTLVSARLPYVYVTFDKPLGILNGNLYLSLFLFIGNLKFSFYQSASQLNLCIFLHYLTQTLNSWLSGNMITFTGAIMQSSSFSLYLYFWEKMSINLRKDMDQVNALYLPISNSLIIIHLYQHIRACAQIEYRTELFISPTIGRT